MAYNSLAQREQASSYYGASSDASTKDAARNSANSVSRQANVPQQAQPGVATAADINQGSGGGSSPGFQPFNGQPLSQEDQRLAREFRRRQLQLIRPPETAERSSIRSRDLFMVQQGLKSKGVLEQFAYGGEQATQRTYDNYNRLYTYH